MPYYRSNSSRGILPDRFTVSIPYTVSCYLKQAQGTITSGAVANGSFSGNRSGTVVIGDATYNWSSSGGSLTVNGQYEKTVSQNGTLTITFIKVN